MKKSLVLIVFCVMLLCACGDTQETETSWKADSLADNSGKLTPPPNGVPIITDQDQFQAVTEDQSYHFETDWQNYLGKTGNNSFLAVGEDSYYYYNGVFLYVFNPKEKRYAKLCNKPECIFVLCLCFSERRAERFLYGRKQCAVSCSYGWERRTGMHYADSRRL